jgi:hypothetical protein
MLTKYLRQFPKFAADGTIISRGDPIGCVVAIDPDHIGYTFCCPKDKFDKKYARNLAAGRALTGTNVNVPNRIVDTYWDSENLRFIDVTLSEVLVETIEDMKIRAHNYLEKQKS